MRTEFLTEHEKITREEMVRLLVAMLVKHHLASVTA